MQDFQRSATVTPQKATVSDISLPSERDVSSDDGSARALRIRQDITVTVQHDQRPETYLANHSTTHVRPREDV